MKTEFEYKGVTYRVRTTKSGVESHATPYQDNEVLCGVHTVATTRVHENRTLEEAVSCKRCRNALGMRNP